MRKVLVALVAALAVLAVPTAASAHGEQSGWKLPDAKVTVVHGVPGLDVDVYANRTKVLTDFKFGTASPTLDVRPGFYRFVVTATGGKEPVLKRWAFLFPGRDYSVVAYLKEGGTPALKVFRNDIRPLAKGQARLIVRHTADAPAVDILAGGQPIIEGLMNGRQAKTEIPGGTYPVAIAPAGSSTPVFGPIDLEVPAGKVTIVYALGSLGGGTFTPAVQTVEPRKGKGG